LVIPAIAGLILALDGVCFGLTLLFSILSDLALALWFSLVLAPFEERELRALFGPAYDEYMRKTQRFLPVARR
jgi:protein-S-isoprenylcysteine O-methyltransferase Ste14